MCTDSIAGQTVGDILTCRGQTLFMLILLLFNLMHFVSIVKSRCFLHNSVHFQSSTFFFFCFFLLKMSYFRQVVCTLFISYTCDFILTGHVQHSWTEEMQGHILCQMLKVRMQVFLCTQMFLFCTEFLKFKIHCKQNVYTA